MKCTRLLTSRDLSTFNRLKGLRQSIYKWNAWDIIHMTWTTRNPSRSLGVYSWIKWSLHKVARHQAVCTWSEEISTGPIKTINEGDKCLECQQFFMCNYSYEKEFLNWLVVFTAQCGDFTKEPSASTDWDITNNCDITWPVGTWKAKVDKWNQKVNKKKQQLVKVASWCNFRYFVS